jgi:small-conductance mechanosensitive channel
MNFVATLGDYGRDWASTALLGAIAVVAALVALAIAKSVLNRLARFSVLLRILLKRTNGPAQLVVPLAALQIVLSAAPGDLYGLASVTRITALLLVVALTWFALRAIGAFAQAIVELHPTNVSDNLEARRVQTQTRVLARTVMFVVLVIGVGAALMTFPAVRQIGASLLASAGVAGLVAGIAARPVLGNLIAGLQIALTQPVRLDDVVIVEGEWGRIEEITATYVVIKIWDERRLVVPLQWMIEHPFQNWTRRQTQLLGTVLLWIDYRVALAPLRAELERVCADAPEWDGRVALLQVVDTNERAMQVRALVSAANASKSWDLRCRVREALIDFLQRQEPDALPRIRTEIERRERTPRHKPSSPPPRKAGVGDSTAIEHPEHGGQHAPPPPKDDIERQTV